MFSIGHHVGKLVEVRVESPVREDEMPGIAARTQAAILSVPGQFVAVMDLRHARLFSQPVADAFITILSGNNPKLERSAFVIGAGAVFALQIERAIVTARNPSRRAFRDTAELEAWLDETLNPSERLRLHEFLEEGIEPQDAGSQA